MRMLVHLSQNILSDNTPIILVIIEFNQKITVFLDRITEK